MPDINWQRVFANISTITGLDFSPHGNRMIAKCYINGAPHKRFDNTVAYFHDGKVAVHENGGQTMMLWDWLLEYGGCTDNVSVAKLLLDCSGNSSIAYREYVEPAKTYVDDAEVTRLEKRYWGALFAFFALSADKKRIREIWREYRIGQIYDTTIFWYINASNLVCHDNRMDYLPDGHRDKEKHARRIFKTVNGYSHTCLFGDHIPENGRKTIVVESEKTALIGAIFYPKFRWLATGGSNKIYSCRDKGYLLAPDYHIDMITMWGGVGELWKWWKGYEDVLALNEDVGDLILYLNKKENERNVE